MLAITLCLFLLLQQHCSAFPISYSVSRTAAIYQYSHRKTYRHYAAAAENSSDSFQRARLANQLQLQQQGNSDTNDAEDRWVADSSSGSAKE